MEDFLNRLYSYEYFGTYLMIAIAVLVLLFVIVLLFGKKDQKKREIEETKRLQQVTGEIAFKQVEKKEPVEVPMPSEAKLTNEQLENDTIIVPNIDALNTDNVTKEEEIPNPVLPTEPVENIASPVLESKTDIEKDVVAPQVEPVVETTVSEIVPPIDVTNIEPPLELKNSNVNSEPTEPVLTKEEEKPLVFENPTLNFDNNVKTDIPETNEVNEPLTEVPTFNFDEIMESIEEAKKEPTPVTPKAPEVFSSVYAPKKEEMEIDLPQIKEEIKESTNDDLDIELPSLKKDLEQSKPEFNSTVSLDDLTGESYNINK